MSSLFIALPVILPSNFSTSPFNSLPTDSVMKSLSNFSLKKLLLVLPISRIVLPHNNRRI